MPLIPVLQRKSQADFCDFDASLVYVASSYLNKINKSLSLVPLARIWNVSVEGCAWFFFGEHVNMICFKGVTKGTQRTWPRMLQLTKIFWKLLLAVFRSKPDWIATEWARPLLLRENSSSGNSLKLFEANSGDKVDKSSYLLLNLSVNKITFWSNTSHNYKNNKTVSGQYSQIFLHIQI